MPPVSGAPDGIPLTLTLQGPPDSWPVGMLAPAGRTPWGCLFFILLGGVFLIWLLHARSAILLGLLGLIAFYAAFNHPRRAAGEAVDRTLRLVGARSGKRALQALRPALDKNPHDDGLHYLAAMVALLDGRSARALEHLEEAKPSLARYAEYHHLRGRCLRDLGRPSDAGPAYRHALDYPAYPSRALLLQEAQAFFVAQGDREGLVWLESLTREDLTPEGPAASQAFRSSLGRLADSDSGD